MRAGSPVSHGQAALPQAQGCLVRFLVPPLLVILIGAGFSLLLRGVEIRLAETGTEKGGQAQADSPAPAQSGLAPLFSPQVLFWEEKILKWSAQKGLDPNLVATVMQIESCGNPHALSSAGAAGLFQVMPYHFQEGENPFHPRTNARRGLNYLKTSLAQGKSVELALAGYNGGIQGAQRPRDKWPAQTVRYVYWGTGIYADAAAGKDHSPRLQEWLSSGGRHLCRQAKAQSGP